MKYINLFFVALCIVLLSGCGLFDIGSSKYKYTNPNINGGDPTQVNAPTFSPSEGNYSTAKSVVITSLTSSADIYYTTDGSTPSCSSGTAYTAPISVSATETIKAIACKDSMNDSAVVSSTYTISSGSTTVVATPTFNYSPGPFIPPLYLVIQTQTLLASIHYTDDGSNPSCQSTLYVGSAGAITITTTKTINAIACKDSMTTSGIATAVYTAQSGAQVASPTFEPGSGNVSASSFNVKISSSTSNSKICTVYSTAPFNPSCAGGAGILCQPSGSSSTYNIAQGATMTIRAIACSNDGTMGPSDYVDATYIYPSGGTQVATPTISPDSGPQTAQLAVYMDCGTDGASIYYTTDNTDPTCFVGTQHINASGGTAIVTVLATGTTTVKAKGCKNGLTPSSLATKYYTLTGGTPTAPAQPVFTPDFDDGPFTAAINVSISEAIFLAPVRWTTDGSVPTCGSPGNGNTGLTNPFTVNISAPGNTTLKAIACQPITGGTPASNPRYSTYTINYPGPCGITGTPCCTTGTACTSTNTVCSPAGVCVSCGESNETCCGTSTAPQLRSTNTGCDVGNCADGSCYCNSNNKCTTQLTCGGGNSCSVDFQCVCNSCISGKCKEVATCFKKGTKILTPSGKISIEKIKSGSVIYSYDETKKELVKNKVIKLITHIKPTDQAVELTLEDGTKLGVTTSHPFYSPIDGKYRKLKELKIGDTVLVHKGSFKEVKIKSIVTKRNFKIDYNLELEGDPHNYIAEGVVVHNTKQH